MIDPQGPRHDRLSSLLANRGIFSALGGARVTFADADADRQLIARNVEANVGHMRGIQICHFACQRPAFRTFPVGRSGGKELKAGSVGLTKVNSTGPSL